MAYHLENPTEEQAQFKNLLEVAIRSASAPKKGSPHDLLVALDLLLLYKDPREQILRWLNNAHQIPSRTDRRSADHSGT
jgi:hypothetical protein